jgi:diaminobutyrate-2-oxoglutarate transaminase
VSKLRGDFGPTIGVLPPGPEGQRYLDRQTAYESNARSYPRRLPLAIRRASGPFVEDVDGNVFVDFLTGAGVLALGHNHPEVVEAVHSQLDLHVHGLDFPTPAKDEFVEAQLSMLPEPMRDRMKIQFCGAAGANAVDAALKLCKTATGRSEVISFHGGFHGSTHSSMAITGLVAQKERVANLMPGVHFFPYPYCYRCPLGLEPETCATNCLLYLENVLDDPNGGIPKPAAVIFEVVQGEGGIVPAPREFVRGLRRVTQERDIPLVVDEIQTGWGRTGEWFAFEHHDVEPDVVLVSKAAGGIGLPISLVIYDERLDAWAPGAHTGTFRGNQLAFAAGAAAARIIERDGVLENVRRLGEYALDELRALQRRTLEIGDVRGLGLMIGLEIVDPETGERDPDLARRIQRQAFERGLLLEVGGRDDTVVRLMPPLNVTRETMEIALEIVGEAVSAAVEEEGLRAAV